MMTYLSIEITQRIGMATILLASITQERIVIVIGPYGAGVHM